MTTTNQTYKPSEGKREEFRKYLEKNGIMDALTKVLVSLYEEVEKPDDALQYILDKLAIQAGLETQKQLMAKLDDANEQIKQLGIELEQLKTQLAPPEEELAVEGEAPPPAEEGGEAAPEEAPPAEEQPTEPPAEEPQA